MNDEPIILALIEKWTQAVEVRDLEATMACHAEDIVMFGVPNIQLQGLKECQASWQAFFDWLGSEGIFRLSELEIKAGSTAALCYGLLRCQGSQGLERKVRLTVGLEKRAGRWLVVHEHHSVASQ